MGAEAESLETSINSTSNIPHCEVLHEPISPREFYERFVANGGKPVLLKGFARNWPAFKVWNGDYLAKTQGDERVRLSRIIPDHGAESFVTTVRNYFRKYAKQEAKIPFYLTDWSVPKALRADYARPDFSQCWHHKIPFVGPSLMSWIFCGAKGTSTPLHADFFGTHATSAVISGKKEWIFLNPEDNDKIYNRQVDPFNPDLERFPLYAKATQTRCVQEAGDLVYGPPGWIHGVRNLEAGISITENFYMTRDWKRALLYVPLVLVLAVAIPYRNWKTARELSSNEA